MITEFKFHNVDELDVTITIRQSLRTWRKVLEHIQAGDKSYFGPVDDLLRQIRVAITTAEKEILVHSEFPRE